MFNIDARRNATTNLSACLICLCIVLSAPANLTASAPEENGADAVMQSAADAEVEQTRLLKHNARDRVLMDDADWVIDSLPLVAVIDMNYSADGKRLTIRGKRRMIVVDALAASVLGEFKHDMHPYDLKLAPKGCTPGDVGTNADATLAAVGTDCGWSWEEEPSSGIVFVSVDGTHEPDTIRFDGNYGVVTASRFLPDDRHLALCLTEDSKRSEDNWSGGRYGIYDYVDKHWLWFEQDTAAASIQVSPSGKFVAFTVYDYRYDWAGTFTTESFSAWGRLVDVEQAVAAPTLMNRFRLKLAADDKMRLYFRISNRGAYLPEVFNHRTGDFKALRVPAVSYNGAFFGDDLYAGLFTNKYEDYSVVRILDPVAGTLQDCLKLPQSLGFAISPDGSKIAIVMHDGTLWQQDFECDSE